MSGKTRYVFHVRQSIQFDALPGVGQVNFNGNLVPPSLALGDRADLHPSVVDYLGESGLLGHPTGS
jgi:hypothetical protein